MNSKAKVVFANIQTRRSIRDYKDKEIPKEYLDLILRAGDAAPSAGDLKSREFIPITKRENINFILNYIFSRRVREHRKKFKNVPLLVLMCAKIARCRKKYRRGRLYAIQDATLAGQNMMLMAHALGIGSCWIGQIREKKIRDEFRINGKIKLVGIIAFGYAA